MRRSPARRFSLPLVAALAVGLLISCGRDSRGLRPFRQSRILMGTLVEITLVGRGEAELEGPFRDAFAEMERIDQLLGSHEQRGEIWSINTGGWPAGIRTTDEVFGVLRRARAIGLAVGGAFDCTVGSLMQLWAFDTGGRVPSEAEIRTTLAAVGWDKIRLDEAERKVTFLVPGVRLDLGGIGKGYAVDRAYGLLRARGVIAGIIDAGGDLRVWGRRPFDSGPWKIGIQHPRHPDDLLGTLTLTDCAIVTSGDYEKKFTIAGRNYMHIMDPSTGRPAEGTQSVTMVTADAETADAYATSLVVMGLERGREFLAGQPQLGAVIVSADGKVWVSPGIEHAFRPPE